MQRQEERARIASKNVEQSLYYVRALKAGATMPCDRLFQNFPLSCYLLSAQFMPLASSVVAGSSVGLRAGPPSVTHHLWPSLTAFDLIVAL